MQNEIKKLDEQIAELTAKRDALLNGGKRWRAEEGREYWFIDSYLQETSSTDIGDLFDDMRYTSGNYFRTEAEAQRALGRMIATQQLKDRIAELNAQQEWVADWSDEKQAKYLPIFVNKSERMSLDCGYLHTWSPVEFFGSKETIKTVIAEMPEQIKLWLGV